MPFAYFGAKHRFARYYPPPAFDTIIEPFAGAAGYSVYWATEKHTVVLVDKDPLVVDMWRQLQDSKIKDVLDDAEAQLTEAHVTSPFIYSIAGGLTRVKPGGQAKTSSMMRQMWPGIRRRIEATLPLIQSRWVIYEDDYTKTPQWTSATVFVDAPYQPIISDAGNRYGMKAHGIDYPSLGGWCLRRSRSNQMIVCEQAPANWLPFEPIATVNTRMRTDDLQPRTEMMWTNGIVAGDAEAQSTEASRRRWARMKPREDKWSPLASR